MRILFVVNMRVELMPLGIMYLSSALKRYGHYTQAVNWNYEEIKRILMEDKFDVIAFSVTAGIYYNRCLEICRRIKKEFNIFTIFGGPHATFSPEIIEEECIDGVCIGEGEEAIVEFADRYQRGRSIADIRNWWIKQDGRIYRNPVRPPVPDLDELPFPDRELFRHFRPLWKRTQSVLTTRGCPYNCTYCYQPSYSKLYKGKWVRRRSVDNVLNELREIKEKFTVNLIAFVDDTFTLSNEWIEEFAVRYKEEINLPFHCYVRANLITPKIAKQLREGGCVDVGMGVEAGDDYVRNSILRRNMTKEDIITASKFIKAQGIKLIAFNILGLPGGSIDTDFETLRLNIDCKPDYARVSFFEPYPKLVLTEKAIEEGLFDGDFDRLFKVPTNRKSLLNFKNKREARAIENLHHLFALTVRFPFILSLVRVLIRIPLGRLYFILFKLSEILILRYLLRDRESSIKEYSKKFIYYLRKIE